LLLLDPELRPRAVPLEDPDLLLELPEPFEPDERELDPAREEPDFDRLFDPEALPRPDRLEEPEPPLELFEPELFEPDPCDCCCSC
jgi:hypothetical protein